MVSRSCLSGDEKRRARPLTGKLNVFIGAEEIQRLSHVIGKQQIFNCDRRFENEKLIKIINSHQHNHVHKNPHWLFVLYCNSGTVFSFFSLSLFLSTPN